MATYFRMMIVLSVITLVSGFALGALNELTYQTAENNILKFKKIPAVATIYEAIAGPLNQEQRLALETELLAEKRTVDLGEKDPLLFFVIKKDNAPYAVAFEKFGQGFGGDLGVMTGFRLDNGDLVGIGVTTMSETPGLGTRVTELAFVDQFKGLARTVVLKIKKDDGEIDAIAGATISSRAVVSAANQASEYYEKHQEQIKSALSQ